MNPREEDLLQLLSEALPSVRSDDWLEWWLLEESEVTFEHYLEQRLAKVNRDRRLWGGRQLVVASAMKSAFGDETNGN